MVASCSMRMATCGAGRTGWRGRNPASSAHRWWRYQDDPERDAPLPANHGFTGMGLDGVGWGTAVTREHVWASSFNGKILVMDFNGHPIAKEDDFPFKEKIFALMGIGLSANGDVWVADGAGDQLLTFPA